MEDWDRITTSLTECVTEYNKICGKWEINGLLDDVSCSIKMELSVLLTDIEDIFKDNLDLDNSDNIQYILFVSLICIAKRNPEVILSIESASSFLSDWKRFYDTIKEMVGDLNVCGNINVNAEMTNLFVETKIKN